MGRPPLTAEQRRLTDDRRDLAASCYPLAIQIANRFARRHRLHPDEVVSEAMWALCDAARTYREDRGVKFVTLAGRTIRLRLCREAAWKSFEGCSFGPVRNRTRIGRLHVGRSR